MGREPRALEKRKAAVAQADIVIVANLLFLEEHIKAILPALQARRDDRCDAMIGVMSAMVRS